jgi:hypothetical protein
MDGDQDMHGEDVMYMTNDNYRYDFKEVNKLMKLNLRARMKAVMPLKLNLRHMGRMKPRIYHATKDKAQLHHRNHNDAKNGLD